MSSQPSQSSLSGADPHPIRVQRFYEQLSVEREAALDRLGDVFTDDIHFRDPFRDTHGMQPFRTVFERALRQYAEFRFSDFHCTGTEDAFTLTYDMHMRMAIGPAFVTRMASICIARGGKVADLTDYYDFTSALLSPMRFFGAAYRTIVNRLFL